MAIVFGIVSFGIILLILCFTVYKLFSLINKFFNSLGEEDNCDNYLNVKTTSLSEEDFKHYDKLLTKFERKLQLIKYDINKICNKKNKPWNLLSDCYSICFDIELEFEHIRNIPLDDEDATELSFLLYNVQFLKKICETEDKKITNATIDYAFSVLRPLEDAIENAINRVPKIKIHLECGVIKCGG